jgi:hypothetical protein
MPATESIPYRRLPGTGSGAFEQIRLYQGPDHLLLVTSSGYYESYKRFYFRDIQAITVRASARGKVWNGLWGSLAVLATIIAVQSSDATFVVWSILAGVFFLLLALNVGKGPTCVCRIQTAVQTRPLPSLNRLRRARKAIAQLRPLIEAAQEPMLPSELTQRLDDARRGSAPSPAGNRPTAIQSESSLPPVT